MQALQNKHMQMGLSAAHTRSQRPGKLTPARALRFPDLPEVRLPSFFGDSTTATLNKGASGRADGNTDMTGRLMEGIVKVALQTRLRSWESIQVNAETNAMDILSGRFGGIKLSGQKWKTPLHLTSQHFEMKLGEVIVNYSALVMEQRISLGNVPAGTCTITLTAQDLGNFVVHQLLKEPASKAVDDQAFVFDRDSVRYWVDPHTKEASIYLEGEWAGDDSRYLVKMTPSSGVSMMSVEHSHPSAPNHKPHGIQRMVASRLGSSTMSSMSSDSEGDAADGEWSAAASLASTEDEASRSKEPTPEEKVAAAAAAILERSSRAASKSSAESTLEGAAALNNEGEGSSTSSSRSRSSTTAPVCNASRIERGLDSFFTHLCVNLQGVELARPRLFLLVPSNAEGAKETGHFPPGQPLLTITMDLRLLAVPPLDMRF
ncbi:hypothetical protein DUNSADRAFT_12138 [Dunaliella salina]|uniref:Uncharacterized protein n=1 Tax=Dunaliella salina TaxID=3046 RepID=A0ABQ7GC03_DUNSA|nr:hypothetical protein DUNSADRAFT_12138 [Dunaliella salina]|eukprot:KAF5832127.1 hypothetical protein DUNSADRAFT_12138 [Dunaliella salina]